MHPSIQTLHLFPKLDKKLTALLRSLKPDDWSKPTLAKQWNVKDIAAHLLDGNIRGISVLRDGFFGENPGDFNSYQDLVNFLNNLNADWVKALKRASPVVITDLLEITGKQYYQALASLKLEEPSVFPVAWAGQTESPNWFHIAREYTEKWHHQQQIREAVGMQGIMAREFFYPLINTFLQALPHAYRHTKASTGTGICVHVTSDAGGTWNLKREEEAWRLTSEIVKPQTAITIDPATAWKLFTNGMSADVAKQKITISGNQDLGKPILSMLSVMA